MRKDRIDAAGASFLIVFSVLLGLNQVMVKLVNAGLAPVFQAGLRSAFSFLPVLVFAWIMRKGLSTTDGSFWPGMLSGIFFSAEFTLLFIALDYTTVSRVSIFFYTMPFWVAVGAHFLVPGEKLTSIRVLGLFVAIAGVVLALWSNDSPATERALRGDLMCLVASMFWAGIVLLVKTTALSRSSPYMQLLYQLAVSAIVLLLVAPLFGELVRDVTPLIVALFAAQVVFVICIGFVVWFWILSVYPASDMASFSFLVPLFGVIFGWLILDEDISSNIVVALILVAIGIVLVNQRPKTIK